MQYAYVPIKTNSPKQLSIVHIYLTILVLSWTLDRIKL